MKKINILFTLVALILLLGCKSTKTEPITPVEEPEIVIIPEEDKELSLEEQEVVVKEYYDLLKEKADNITEFVDENISKLDSKYVDEIIITLEEHLKLSNPSIIELTSKLNKYYEYASEEIKSYLDILNKEAETIFADEEEIKISVDELLERAKIAEVHLKKYVGKETYNKVYNLYENYIVGAIIGTGNQYIYANEGLSTIRDDVLNKYKEFIKNNKDSYTSNLLSRYLDELNLEEMSMNGENVIIFYEDLGDIIKEYTR